MQLKHLLPAAAVYAVAAQGDGSNRSFQDALNSQNASLSLLNSLLASQPALVSSLGSATNVTLLAPNNDAISRLLNSTTGQMVASDPGLLNAILTYHVLSGTYYASAFTNASGPLFVPTLLTNTTYANVTGGQRVEAMYANKNVAVISGLLQSSTVVTTNVNFTGGTIHIIDTVFTIPSSDAATAEAADLTALAGALTQAKLVDTVNGLKDVTIFAPNNEAFNAIGSLTGNLSTSQLSSILEYHVVSGSVVYSPMIQNGSTVKALAGGDLKFTIVDGEVFVNSAKVIKPDVLVANGVVHVIDNVLNPGNTTATPNPTAGTQPPAYSGATTTNSVPYTGNVPAPTTMLTGVAATGTATTAAGGAGAMPTGAVGAAALFGGAALLVNL